MFAKIYGNRSFSEAPLSPQTSLGKAGISEGSEETRRPTTSDTSIPITIRISERLKKTSRVSTLFRRRGIVDRKQRFSNVQPIRSTFTIVYKPITFVLLNAQSSRNKTSDFVDYIIDTDADILAITETWFKYTDNVIKVECTPSGYTLLDEPRIGRHGGGIALLYKNPLHISKIAGGEKNRLNFLNGLYHALTINCVY